MKKNMTWLTLCTLFASPLFAENAMDIVMKHDKQKAEALVAYLNANADASDRSEAIDALIETKMTHDDTEGLLPFAMEKYKNIQKKAPNTGRDVFMSTQVIVDLLVKSEGKAAAKKFIDQVYVDIEDSPEEKPLSEALEHIESSLNQPQVGEPLDIAFTDINGKKVNLSEMNGKVVLVDFWATWCGPCVGELPNVKEAYNKFHDKGFEIVGISLDQDKAALTSFIEKNGMPWVQYFDGKGWENDISTKFGIQSIPATFLIGKDGKIVDRDMRGPALSAAVEKALN